MIGETAFTIFALLALSLSGAFVLVPFTKNHRFALLLAPACGMLVLPVTVTVLFSSLKPHLGSAILMAFAVTASASVAALVLWRPSPRDAIYSVLLAIVVATAATAFASSTTIHLGSPGILYYGGTDHAGYAHLADWFLHHSISQMPQLSPGRPYESWPFYMVTEDPRLSSYLFLAIIAWAHGTSGLFSYDAALAIVLAAGILSVAAVFCRSRLSLTLLSIGLFACGWPLLGRYGFLGKAIAYPAVILVAGLVMTSVYRDVRTIAALAVLTLGTAVMHSGFGTGLILLFVLGTWVVTQWTFGKTSAADLFRYEVPVIALLVSVSLVATGMFALPRGTPDAFDHPGWAGILTVLSGVDGLIKLLPPWLGRAALIATLALQIALIAFSVFRRSSVAIALALGPMLLVALLWMADLLGIAIQLIGIPAACALCAAVHLWDGEAIRFKSATGNFEPHAAAALCLFVALIIPRMLQVPQMVSRYALWPDKRYQYSLVEFDKLAQAIGPRKTVEVEPSDVYTLLPLLLEFGRRGIEMQWTAASWHGILGYRDWPVPTYANKPDFRITSNDFGPAITGAPVLSTAHYTIYRGENP